MKRNLGIVDKAIRLSIAVALISMNLSGTLTGTSGIIALVVAATFIFTSLVSVCPTYSIFGWSTWEGNNRITTRK